MIADRRVTSVFVLVVLALASCGGADDRPFAGTRRSPAPVIESTLPAVGGDDFVFRAEPDDVLVVYFGYTSCPDVCPTTMTDLTFARSELGDDADRVDVAMVTVDPQRDSEEILTDYVNSFVPGSTAVRTEDELELRAVADSGHIEFDRGDVQLADLFETRVGGSTADQVANHVAADADQPPLLRAGGLERLPVFPRSLERLLHGLVR